jgi:hypothetical protein
MAKDSWDRAAEHFIGASAIPRIWWTDEMLTIIGAFESAEALEQRARYQETIDMEASERE